VARVLTRDGSKYQLSDASNPVRKETFTSAFGRGETPYILLYVDESKKDSYLHRQNELRKLENLGNTCFANSALQLISMIMKSQ
jgi:ubiquitin C-terminal hydrolase